jgi:anti-anti-sigma factor
MIVTGELTDDGYRIRIAGSVDTSNAAAVATEVDRAWDAPPGVPIRVDLARVEFMDSAGLGVLLMARMRAREVGRRLSVVAPSPTVDRLLRVSGLRDILLYDA